MGEEKGEAVCDRQGFSVRHGDADVVRARLVGVEPGLDQPILLHGLLSGGRKGPSSTPHARHAIRRMNSRTRSMQQASIFQHVTHSTALRLPLCRSVPKHMLRKDAHLARVLYFGGTAAVRCAMLQRVVVTALSAPWRAAAVTG